MISTNVESHFTVTQFAKLLTAIVVIEKLQPGSINYLGQTASLLADNWTIESRVSNRERALAAIKEFQSWLDSQEEPVGNEEEPDSNYYVL